MKILRKKAVIIPVAVLLVVGIAFLAYSIIRGQGKLSPYEINTDSGTQVRVLVATHQTTSKDTIMEEVRQYYGDKPIFISVVDAGTLGDIEIDDWDGVVIFSAIEFGQPPKEVSNFITENEGSDNMALFLTVDAEQWNTDLDVDTIASASKNTKSNGIINFIDNILKR